ncbi:lipid asymmetry maintenance ABC transporter permease subunit MlaE [Acidithiobacillus sp. IBUN Pt1247-S3]|uniref:lipid asymmetry maintenance ABC transporter permease subunit MlaE n=1 Tax=Acidithiobacillus sp. IBUN Pt1247-S3 TaxID=3166642 RepID=UPI0034E4D1E5
MSDFFVPRLGHVVWETVPRLGAATRLLLGGLSAVGNRHFSFRQWLREVYGLGVLSLALMIVAALFTGMVLGFQGYYALVRFGATSALGTLIALSLLRELGPVLTALLFAGRAGSALTAEIGSMKATEQLAAMEMMAVNPLAWVVAPRLWGGIFAVPILCVIFDLVGIFGGYLVSVPVLGVDGGTFWAQMQSNVTLSGDILNGLLKALCFGLVVTWIAVWQGFSAKPTAEGVGAATTRSVVMASLTVLGLDFILTALLF